MKIDILGNKIDLTPSIKKYVNDKLVPLGKMISRFEKEGETTLFVEIARATRHHKKGDVFYVEATVSLPGKTLRAENFADDARDGIDSIRKVLKLELQKFKEKKEDKKYGRKTKKVF